MARGLGFYILHGKTPVRATDVVTWAKWMENTPEKDRLVAFDTINGARVSTMFLGIGMTRIDGGYDLFESMVFGGPFDGLILRYETWVQAEEGHREIVAKMKAAARN